MTDDDYQAAEDEVRANFSDLLSKTYLSDELEVSEKHHQSVQRAHGAIISMTEAVMEHLQYALDNRNYGDAEEHQVALEDIEVLHHAIEHLDLMCSGHLARLKVGPEKPVSAEEKVPDSVWSTFEEALAKPPATELPQLWLDHGGHSLLLKSWVSFTWDNGMESKYIGQVVELREDGGVLVLWTTGRRTVAQPKNLELQGDGPEDLG